MNTHARWRDGIARSLTAAAAAMLVAAGPASTAAQPASATIVASDAVQAALVELKPRIERETGRSVTFRFGTSPILQRNIMEGEAFDVAVLPPSVVAALGTAGKIVRNRIVDVGRVGIGIGVKSGAPRPDIRTRDALKQTLLAAKSITYVKDGASRANVEQMLDRIGIAQQAQAKTLLLSGFEEMGRAVVDGRAEFVFAPLSEIPLMRGIDVLGPLPGDLQTYVSFQIAVSASARDMKAADGIVRVLDPASAGPIYRAKGLDVR